LIPAIAASGNNVYVVWSDSTQGNYQIMFKRTTNGGPGFDGAISFSNTNASLPAIAASGNNVYVVWSDSTPGNSGILYKRSTNGGPGFGGAINISNGVGGGFFPDIAAIENIT
jgi:hypothetical protein